MKNGQGFLGASKRITFKKKEIDKNGNILNQKVINCGITDINEAKELLKELDYREIMTIIENGTIYEKDGLEIEVKDIKNGDKLIEIETNERYATIDDLKKILKRLEIPVDLSDCFIKKAEIELAKILK